MKVIVMGFGRIGSQVAKLLADQHHDVTIIDHESNAGMRIDAAFTGRVIKGVGFDRKVLLQAGIEQADVARAQAPIAIERRRIVWPRSRCSRISPRSSWPTSTPW